MDMREVVDLTGSDDECGLGLVHRAVVRAFERPRAVHVWAKLRGEWCLARIDRANARRLLLAFEMGESALVAADDVVNDVVPWWFDSEIESPSGLLPDAGAAVEVMGERGWLRGRVDKLLPGGGVRVETDEGNVDVSSCSLRVSIRVPGLGFSLAPYCDKKKRQRDVPRVPARSTSRRLPFVMWPAAAEENPPTFEHIESLLRDEFEDGRSESITLGLVMRCGAHVATETFKYTRLTKALNAFFRARRPDVPYTSVTLNCNYNFPVHRHLNNRGKSNIVAFGDYRDGGELWVDDGGGDEGDGTLFDVKHRLLEFSGQMWHANCAHRRGKWRFSIVYYRLGRLPPSGVAPARPHAVTSKELEDFGFPPQTDSCNTPESEDRVAAERRYIRAIQIRRDAAEKCG